VNVLRDAMAVDSLDSCGIYFGIPGSGLTAHQIRRTWAPIVRDLPGRRVRRGSDAEVRSLETEKFSQPE